jgi:hypothetical protein
MGVLRVNVCDVYGNLVNEQVDILAFNQRLASDRHRFSAVAKATLALHGLRDATDNMYTLQVDAPSYLPVQQFVNVTPGKEITVTLPIDISKVAGADFPAFGRLPADTRRLLGDSNSVEGIENKSGAALYREFPELPCAGFLNVSKKCSGTILAPGESVLAHVGEVLKIKPDRIFARVPAGLRDAVDSLDEVFDAAPGGLHSFKDYALAGSWKTRERVANLQLTFFKKGRDWVADIDIDDRNGFAHLFQVVSNVFTGGTHPFNIQQMLIKAELDPGYKLQLQQTLPVAATARKSVTRPHSARRSAAGA